VENPSQTPKPEPPDGMYPARMDDKGRVKLPTAFKEYLDSLDDKKLFVTSLDRRIAQIYPIRLWRDTKKFLEDFTADPAAAENLYFNALDLGAEAEMDAQGRVLFSPELRRELGMEDQPVRVYGYAGRIEVLNGPTYEQRKANASRNPDEDRATLKKAGLK
jgi:transcriptional regulator MraZ